MAKLETLRPSVYNMSDEEMELFVEDYRSRRFAQLDIITPAPRTKQKKPAATEMKIMLSPEEKALAKELGIPMREFLKRRTS